MRREILFFEHDSRTRPGVAVGIGALVVTHRLGDRDEDCRLLPQADLGDRARARTRDDQVGDRGGALERRFREVLERMISERVRRARKRDSRDRLHVFEMQGPRLVDDVGERDEVGERREHSLVYRERALRAAEDNERRDAFFKLQVLPRALYLDVGERLTDGDAGAGDAAAHLLGEIGRGALKGDSDLLRPWSGEQIRAAGLRIRLVDDERDAEEPHRENGRHAAVAALRDDHVGIETEEHKDGRERAGKRDEVIEDIFERTVSADLPCRYPDKSDPVLKKCFLVEGVRREIVEFGRDETPLAYKVIDRFGDSDDRIKMSARSSSRKRDGHTLYLSI